MVCDIASMTNSSPCSAGVTSRPIAALSTNGLDYVLQPATFFLRAAWEAVGGLDMGLRYCLDWDIILRIARSDTPRSRSTSSSR